MKERALLPPRALLLALLAQLPLLVLFWPPTLRIAAGLVGIVLFGVGAFLNVAADRQMKKSKVEVCPFHSTPQLIADGPFRFTRNPMYLGMILLAAAPAVFLGLWFNLLPAAR